MRASAVFLPVVLASLAAAQAIPSPEQFFGFPIGADRKLARYDRMVEYFQKIAALSDRLRVRNLGPTTSGQPMMMLELSSAATLRNLDRYQALERKLYFQGGAPTESEREQIFRDGKAVVFITCNIHSTEIGTSQSPIELAYRLATENSPAVRKILDNVILLLVPSANPDGQIMVTDWYNRYLGTAQEGSVPPYLYHPYAGHDNNRDMFLLSQKESRMTAQVLWHDWFPAIWLDQHQQGPGGARMFTMPAADPINPNVDPLIYRLNAIFGQMQAGALEAAGKSGITHNSTYTSFWEGAMAWAGWWHNQVGLLTEVAGARLATPVVQLEAEPGRPAANVVPAPGEKLPLGNNLPPDAPLPPPRDVTPRSDYPRPWLGGSWSLRDIVDYETISTMALLEAAADYRETLLRQIYEINASTIEAGRSGTLGFGDKEPAYAVLIPAAGQHDPNEVIELVDKLRLGGVEVYRSRTEFRMNDQSWAAGTYVVPFTQVFARYAKDLLEVQSYPDVQRVTGSPSDGPYDVSAWSLGMQFGVKTEFARDPLPADLALEKVAAQPAYILSAERGTSWVSFPYTGAESAVVVNRLLKAGARVSLRAGRAEAQASPQAWAQATRGFDVFMKSTAAAPEPGTTLRLPRVGLYQSWTANIDEGWTRWVLEQAGFAYTTLHNADIQAGRLRTRFDAIILPDQTARGLLEGQTTAAVPAQYRGGLRERGMLALKDFVDQGGTLIALGDASNLLVDRMTLPVKELKRDALIDQHDGPGTILRLEVDATHPVGWGMPAETFGFYVNSPFFEVTGNAAVVARYPGAGVVASGFLKGEEYMTGRAAVVAINMNPGKVVLFGIRPQHRGQTRATLPMLFNALYWSVEEQSGSGATQ